MQLQPRSPRGATEHIKNTLELLSKVPHEHLLSSLDGICLLKPIPSNHIPSLLTRVSLLTGLSLLQQHVPGKDISAVLTALLFLLQHIPEESFVPVLQDVLHGGFEPNQIVTAVDVLRVYGNSSRNSVESSSSSSSLIRWSSDSRTTAHSSRTSLQSVDGSTDEHVRGVSQIQRGSSSELPIRSENRLEVIAQRQSEFVPIPQANPSSSANLPVASPIPSASRTALLERAACDHPVIPHSGNGPSQGINVSNKKKPKKEPAAIIKRKDFKGFVEGWFDEVDERTFKDLVPRLCMILNKYSNSLHARVLTAAADLVQHHDEFYGVFRDFQILRPSETREAAANRVKGSKSCGDIPRLKTIKTFMLQALAEYLAQLHARPSVEDVHPPLDVAPYGPGNTGGPGPQSQAFLAKYVPQSHARPSVEDVHPPLHGPPRGLETIDGPVSQSQAFHGIGLAGDKSERTKRPSSVVLQNLQPAKRSQTANDLPNTPPGIDDMQLEGTHDRAVSSPSGIDSTDSTDKDFDTLFEEFVSCPETVQRHGAAQVNNDPNRNSLAFQTLVGADLANSSDAQYQNSEHFLGASMQTAHGVFDDQGMRQLGLGIYYNQDQGVPGATLPFSSERPSSGHNRRVKIFRRGT